MLVLGLIPTGTGLGDTGSTTQGLNLTIAPIAKLTAPATATLTRGVNPFTTFQASVPITYRARTTSTGGGSITIKVTSDFLPATGPLAASGNLTYTCGAASLGTACSGSQTASTSLQTPVLTLPASACTGGGGVCSSSDPNSITLNFTLTDDPGFATGSYSAQITFTISAT